MTSEPALTRYHTQWAAQFFVAAELTRRGYVVAVTLGHAPSADLLAESPQGVPVAVEVKGQRTHGYWIVRPPARPRRHRRYVLVYVPKPPASPEFFVLTPDEIEVLTRDYRARITQEKGPWPEGEWDGFNWGDALPYRDRWDKFPK